MLRERFGALSLDAPLFLDLLALPRPLVFAIFALLPVDTRLRCSEVNRAWRALLADTTLYSRLDLSVSSGLIRFNDALLRAAVAKAGGQLRALDITGQTQIRRVFDEVEGGGGGAPRRYTHLLLELVPANAATLTELRMNTVHFWAPEEVRYLLEAAPALSLLQTTVAVDQNHRVACDMMRNEPPFQAVQLQRLILFNCVETTADVEAFSLSMRSHASLEELSLFGGKMDTGATMGAVADACIILKIRKLELSACLVAPVTLLELTRLIAAGVLRELLMTLNLLIFDEAEESTRLFVAAVRASAMTRLQLRGLRDLPDTVADVVAFIKARPQ